MIRSTTESDFLPILYQNSPSAAVGFMLLVGINILYIVCEQISEQMEMPSFQTESGSFHGVEYRGSKKGEIFSFLKNIHSHLNIEGDHVWDSSFTAFEGMLFWGTFFQRQITTT